MFTYLVIAQATGITLALVLMILAGVLLTWKIITAKTTQTNTKLELLRRVVYDAVALAAEEAAIQKKLGGTVPSPEAKHDIASKHIKTIFPKATDDEVTQAIRSTLAKLNNEGSTGKNKVQV
jgi:hypothetical protein